MQEVKSGPDSIVLQDKASKDIIKIFIALEDKFIDHKRESFISQYLLSQPSLALNPFIIAATDFGITQDVTNYRNKFKDVYNTPYMRIPNVSGNDLSDWIEKQPKAIKPSIIQKFAFQLIFALAKCQIEYGLQHNDIHEGNIRVQEVQGPEDLTFSIKLSDTDTQYYKVPLEAGDIKLTLIDWGGGMVNIDDDRSINKENIWRTAGGIALQRNNPPEIFLGPIWYNSKKSEVKYIRKSPANDMWTVGHILMSMSAHRRWSNYTYTRYVGPHMYNFYSDDLASSIQATFKFKGVEGLDDGGPFPDEYDDKGEQYTGDNFLVRMKCIYNMLQDSSTPVAEVSPSNILEPFKALNCDSIKFFDGLENDLKDAKTYRIIQKLMIFNPNQRLSFGVSETKFGLLAPLFHHYFREFITTSISTATYNLEFFQPLIYNSNDGNKTKKLNMLKNIESKFNTDYINKYQSLSTAIKFETISDFKSNFGTMTKDQLEQFTVDYFGLLSRTKIKPEIIKNQALLLDPNASGPNKEEYINNIIEYIKINHGMMEKPKTSASPSSPPVNPPSSPPPVNPPSTKTSPEIEDCKKLILEVLNGGKFKKDDPEPNLVTRVQKCLDFIYNEATDKDMLTKLGIAQEKNKQARIAIARPNNSSKTQKQFQLLYDSDDNEFFPVNIGTSMSFLAVALFVISTGKVYNDNWRERLDAKNVDTIPKILSTLEDIVGKDFLQNGATTTTKPSDNTDSTSSTETPKKTTPSSPPLPKKTTPEPSPASSPKNSPKKTTPTSSDNNEDVLVNLLDYKTNKGVADTAKQRAEYNNLKLQYITREMIAKLMDKLKNENQLNSDVLDNIYKLYTAGKTQPNNNKRIDALKLALKRRNPLQEIENKEAYINGLKPILELNELNEYPKDIESNYNGILKKIGEIMDVQDYDKLRTLLMKDDDVKKFFVNNTIPTKKQGGGNPISSNLAKAFTTSKGFEIAAQGMINRNTIYITVPDKYEDFILDILNLYLAALMMPEPSRAIFNSQEHIRLRKEALYRGVNTFINEKAASIKSYIDILENIEHNEMYVDIENNQYNIEDINSDIFSSLHDYTKKHWDVISKSTYWKNEFEKYGFTYESTGPSIPSNWSFQTSTKYFHALSNIASVLDHLDNQKLITDDMLVRSRVEWPYEELKK